MVLPIPVGPGPPGGLAGPLPPEAAARIPCLRWLVIAMLVLAAARLALRDSILGVLSDLCGALATALLIQEDPFFSVLRNLHSACGGLCGSGISCLMPSLFLNGVNALFGLWRMFEMAWAYHAVCLSKAQGGEAEAADGGGAAWEPRFLGGEEPRGGGGNLTRPGGAGPGGGERLERRREELCGALLPVIGVLLLQTVVQLAACQVSWSMLREIRSRLEESLEGDAPWGYAPDTFDQADEAALQQALALSRLETHGGGRPGGGGGGGDDPALRRALELSQQEHQQQAQASQADDIALQRALLNSRLEDARRRQGGQA